MLFFLKLIRYKNLLMVFLTMILTKYTITKSTDFTHIYNSNFFLLSLLTILITAAGYIVNDLYDIEADLINKPKKPSINTTFSIKKAWFFYVLISLSGFFLAFYFSNQLIHYFIFFGTPVLLFYYSKYFKKIALLGNIIVSIAASIPIYIVYIFDITYLKNEITYLFIISYMFFAFLTTLLREIIKDIEDVDGDLRIQANTLPILIGRKRAAKVAFFVSSTLLFFLFVTLLIYKDEIILLTYVILCIVFPLLYFMYKLWIAENKKDFSRLSKFLKIIMFFGIVSMLLLKTILIAA